MLARIVNHLRAQWAGVLALFLVLTGGVAYAANTVFSEDIVNGEVKSADIGTDEVRSVDVRDDTLAGGGLEAADLRSGSVGPAEAAGLTGADIANAASGSDDVNANRLDGIDSSGLVQGSGKVLARRFILPYTGEPVRTIFEIPGFGRLDALCPYDSAEIFFINTTNGDVDLWTDGVGTPSHQVIQAARRRLWCTPIGDRGVDGRARFWRRPRRQKDGDRALVRQSGRSGRPVHLSGSGDAVDGMSSGAA